MMHRLNLFIVINLVKAKAFIHCDKALNLFIVINLFKVKAFIHCDKFI